LKSQLDTYGADVIWTYDKSYKLVSNTNVLPTKYSGLDLNFGQPDLTNIFKDDYLAHFYKNTDVGVIEVYGATVHPSSDVEHKTTPQGYFFVARIIGQDYLTKLEPLTDDKITLVTNIEDRTDVKPQPKSGLIDFSQDLKDENNNSVAQLDVQFYSAAISSLLTSLKSIFTIAVIFSVTTSILFYSAFSIIIINPLAKIYRSLLTDDLVEIERLKSNSSELGRVADLIDKSIRQKQEIAETAIRMQKSQLALESRTKEIEEINSLMIDRELKMIELKAEVKTLKSTKN
jgi:hypothetical protein